MCSKRSLSSCNKSWSKSTKMADWSRIRIPRNWCSWSTCECHFSILDPTFRIWSSSKTLKTCFYSITTLKKSVVTHYSSTWIYRCLICRIIGSLSCRAWHTWIAWSSSTSVTTWLRNTMQRMSFRRTCRLFEWLATQLSKVTQSTAKKLLWHSTTSANLTRLRSFRLRDCSIKDYCQSTWNSKSRRNLSSSREKEWRKRPGRRWSMICTPKWWMSKESVRKHV